jgi:hypothetical protein
VDGSYGVVNMTREELKEFLREPLMPENDLDKWRREVREQEERFERAREKEHEKERSLTVGAEMQRWREYFEGLIASERAAMVEQVRYAQDVMIEAAGQALAEARHEIEVANKCVIDTVFADVRKDIASLQQTFGKQKTTIEKLLPEIALLKRQVKSLEDAHNKSIQTSIGYLQQRVASMEDAQRVAGGHAIAKLQTRIEAAEDELRGTAKLANLPAWITDR